MKRILSVVLLLLLLFCLCSCTRLGEQDSLDFLYSMQEAGYACDISETLSGKEVIECCYVEDCKLTMLSTEQGKLYRVMLTYSQNTDRKKVIPLMEACIVSMGEHTQEEAKAVLKALGIGSALPSDTGNVTRCTEQWYFYSFTSQDIGGQLMIDSLRLNPTTAPTVTVRTTVPSPEKAEPSS